MLIDYLLELAFPVSKVEERATSQILPLIDHLIKYLRYKDPDNSKVYLATIWNISSKICFLVSKSKTRISENKIKKWIKFSDIDSDVLVRIDYFDFKYDLEIVRDKTTVVKVVKQFLERLIHVACSKTCEHNLTGLVRDLEKFKIGLTV